MAKKFTMFPQSCQGCAALYIHLELSKLYSGGCMKSFGNYYCTSAKKHFKLTKTNVNYLRPSKCPIQIEHPIIYDEP